MKIAKETIINSTENLLISTTNKFWGLISIFSSIQENGVTIESNRTYEVNTKFICERLEDLFYFGESSKNFNDNPIYFRLSKYWIELFDEIIIKGKPNILDVAIFFFKNGEFKKISSTELVSMFIDRINLSKEVIEKIFNLNFKDYNINIEKEYSKTELLNLIKNRKKLNSDHLTFSFESPFLIASHPAELKRAPFIQTLYSGTKIQEIILITDLNIEEYYFYNKLNFTNKSPLTPSKNTIYYGSPGTGKSYKVNETLKTLDKKFYERITFHPEYDNACFVGGYKPISRDGEIKYEFVPQVFTNIYVKAWQDLDNQYYLAIEEINRGNCAEIFGDIFQLLDRNSNYDVTPSSELHQHLIDELGAEHDGVKWGLKLPSNLAILATMNTSDQSLFPMDSAFKRRWDWEYIPICYDEIPENKSSQYVINIDETSSFKWIDFIKNTNAIIKINPNLGMDKCIGNYFIKAENNEISLKEFVNKAIFYLWNDVFKDEDDSIFEKGTSYEDFFPIETNGKQEIAKILKAINIEPTLV